MRALPLLAPALILVAPLARADEPPPSLGAAAAASARPPEAEVAPGEGARPTAPPPEAPPPLPRRKGVVLDAHLGALGFLGRFKEVAPPAWWLHVQLGYEVLSWLMLFGEAELAFTDTSVAHDPTKVRAFPIFGFGAGMRATVRPTDRVGLYLQGAVDALQADVPKNAFLFIGYGDAESLAPAFGGRLGVEWYQVDRHLALGLAGGLRNATGFAKRSASGSDTPLLWDGSAALRYTF